MADYPEHEKLTALGGDNQTIGDFLEWLFHEQGIRFTRFDDKYDERRCSRPDRMTPNEVDSINGLRELSAAFSGTEPPDPLSPSMDLIHDRDCDECGGTGWVMFTSGQDWVEASPPGWGSRTEKWLALYFDIDQKKIEAEKQQMLAELRRQNDERDNAKAAANG